MANQSDGSGSNLSWCYVICLVHVVSFCAQRERASSFAHHHSLFPHFTFFLKQQLRAIKMSARDDDLIDYEDDEGLNGVPATGAGMVAKADGADGEKNFPGIHSTGFR